MFAAVLFALLAVGPGPLRQAHAAGAALATIRIGDAEIFGTLDALSAGEIEAARLASSKGSTREVRDYAAMLVRDHQAARKAGSDLAQHLGITPAAPTDNSLATAHAAEMARLSQVSGAAFDKAFVQAMADDHRSAIDKVTGTLVPAAQNAKLKAWMQQMVPTLQSHLTAAEALNK
jgi:putative membrane protein